MPVKFVSGSKRPPSNTPTAGDSPGRSRTESQACKNGLPKPVLHCIDSLQSAVLTANVSFFGGWYRSSTIKREENPAYSNCPVLARTRPLARKRWRSSSSFLSISPVGREIISIMQYIVPQKSVGRNAILEE